MPTDAPTRTRRLVLKQRDWTAAEAFAERHGWSEQPTEDSGTGRKSRIWPVDDDIHFQVTRDRDSGEYSCFFFGTDRERLGQLLGEAEHELDTWSLVELREAPYEEVNPRRLAQSLFRLGLGAPPTHSPEFMPPLSHGLANEQPMVRAAAARTTAYMEWPQLFPLVKVMAESDADERVRGEAKKIVHVYRRAGLGDA